MDSRYLRQLPFWGEEGQQELARKTVAVIGIGALGGVAAELLCRAGIGKLLLVDHDIVELDNLQRQSLYDEKDVGRLKVDAAEEKLSSINSEVHIEGIAAHTDGESIKKIFSSTKIDMLLDCTDNLETRFVLNKFCKEQAIPWVHCAAAGTKGVVLPITDGFCFSCVFASAKQALTCEELGILNTASFSAASLQVNEALKILLKKEVRNELVVFDLWRGIFEKIKVKKNESCDVCNKNMQFKTTEGETEESALVHKNGFPFMISKCRTKAAFTAKPLKQVKLNLQKLKEQFGTAIETPILLLVEVDGIAVIVHEYGELVFKNCADVQLMERIAERVYGAGVDK